jgi:hypothetical protein
VILWDVLNGVTGQWYEIVSCEKASERDRRRYEKNIFMNILESFFVDAL